MRLWRAVGTTLFALGAAVGLCVAPTGASAADPVIMGCTIVSNPTATFRSDDLSDTNILYANLEGTTIALSNLDRLYSGDLNGTPAFLPAHYSVIGGYLVGPGVRLSDLYFNMTDLRGVLFTNASLDRARFVNADLSGGSLHGAELPRTTWQNTICPDGTNSDNDGDTCADNRTP